MYRYKVKALEEMKNLLFFFLLTQKEKNAKKIYVNWNKNKILKAYKRPDEKTIIKMLIELKKEIQHYGKNI